MSTEVTQEFIGNQFDLLNRLVLDEIENIDPAGSVDTMLRMNELVLFINKAVKEWKKATDAKMIEVIKANGDIQVGDKRYYVGAKSVHICVSKNETLSAILDAVNGSEKLASQYLCSEPFKRGEVKKLIGDKNHDTFFIKEIVEDVKTGKPLKSLQVIDKRYIK